MRAFGLPLAVGLLGGLLLSWMIRVPGDSGGSAVATESILARLDSLEAELNAARAEQAATRNVLQSLEREFGAAVAEVVVPGDTVAAAAAAADGQPPAEVPGALPGGPFARGGFNRRNRQDQVTLLTEAGFTRADAEMIDRRVEELQVEAMQARYDALRGPETPGALLEAIREPDSALRAELGDASYERYLTALGRPTDVGVSSVLASSAAEVAGLQSGDRIVAYGGERVFSQMDLNEALLAGAAGEQVLVEIVRDGQSMQVVMPRGPLGISTGFGGRFRRPGR